MVLTLTCYAAAIVGVSLIGGILPLATALTHTQLQVYLSFSAGAMLGAAFLHMMPEAVETGSKDVFVWVATGLLALFFLERFFAFHHHESPADPREPCPTHPHEHGPGRGHSAGLVHGLALGGGESGSAAKGSSLNWGAAAFGLAVHSLTGGVALASAAATDVRLGPGHSAAAWGVFLATIIHKPADALTIVSLMLRAGASKPKAHLINLGFALMIPLGMVLFSAGAGLLGGGRIAHLNGPLWTSRALAFSAGTFLCIALSDLLPELQFHKHDRLKLSAALLFGFALMHH